jgi:nitrite reductase/ring-hydroxylating ferredoxin subunit
MNAPPPGPEPRLTAPITKGLTSVAAVADDWYVACRSRELRTAPRAIMILGIPLVLFRGTDGKPGALLDRCPHRNVPLSLGQVAGPNLRCSYHGWEFDLGGTCRVVPGLVGEPEAKGRCVASYPVREQDGFVWVYPTPDAEPAREPFSFPLVGKTGYTTVYQEVEAQGSLHACAENALDVPHTAFLHKGLFRGSGDPIEIDVVVRRWHDRVEAEYIGEPPPPGIARKILAPGAEGTVIHFDRFFLPGIVQVEYRLGDVTHFCVTTALTPVEDFHTRLFAALSFRLPLPHWLVVLFLGPVGRKIFQQDAVILAKQTEAVKRFGGEQFSSTEIDVMGQEILRLLRSAERDERKALDEPVTKTLKLRV